MKQAVGKKKELYKKASGRKSERAWEEHKTANRGTKHIVSEAKGADWIRCGKQLQKSFLENQRSFWKKAKEKNSTSRLNTGTELGKEWQNAD